MKRTLKVLLLTLLCAAICLPMTAMAYSEINVPEAKEFLEIYVNPLYNELLSKDDVLAITADIPVAYSAETFNDIEAAGTYLREKMIARETSVSFVYSGFTGTPDELFWSIYEEAVKHTGVPDEGDYIKSHLIWFGNHITETASDVSMQISLTFLTDAELEKAVDAEVAKLLSELALGGKSDYEKVEAVHHWICENITYDYDNLEDTTYLLKHSTYAALIDKTAVCQGYASLFYRLMMELGVDCRYITGTGNGGPHAWNIVKLGELYYNIDTTWDAETYQAYGNFQACRYFLTCDANFDGHTRDEEYTTAEFNAAYPMSQSDFDNWAEAPDSPDEVHDGIVFKAWNNPRKLPDTAGNYYLTVDVELYGDWDTPSGEINLCLNGHTIINTDVSDTNAIYVNIDSSLNIYDCSENGGGTIKCGGNYFGSIINEGVLNIYGGNIMGVGEYISAVADYGTMTFNGGTISGGGYGIFVNQLGKLTVNGGTINACGKGIDLNGCPVTVNGGTINGEEAGMAIYFDGVLTVNGGNISGGNYGIEVGSVMMETDITGEEELRKFVSPGTVIVNDGIIDGGRYGIYNCEGTTNIIGGTVTGNDCGIYNRAGSIIVDGKPVECRNNTLTVKGGIVSGNCGISNYGKLLIEGGTVKGIGENGCGIFNIGELTVNGGSVIGEIYGISPNGDATTVINGGTISGNDSGIWCTANSLDVRGGTISGVNYGIEIVRGGVNVNGGTISGGEAGIHLHYEGALNLSGDASISGGGAGILLDYNYITVVGELKNAEPYTVAMSAWDPESESYIVSQDIIPEVFTNTETENLKYNDPAKFASTEVIAKRGYIVVKNDDGQLGVVTDSSATVIPEEGAPEIAISEETLAAIYDEVLTEEEKSNRTRLEIQVSAPIDESYVDSNDAEAIEEAIEGKYTAVGQYLDISLVKIMYGAEYMVTDELDTSISLTIEIPDNLLSDIPEGYTRHFSVVHVHNGVAEILNDIDGNATDGSITITVNSFSPFAIVYKDTSDALFTLGDINDDGELDILDAVSLVQYIFDGNAESLDVFNELSADVNKDGEIDILDAVALVEMIFNS